MYKDPLGRDLSLKKQQYAVSKTLTDFFGSVDHIEAMSEECLKAFCISGIKFRLDNFEIEKYDDHQQFKPSS